MLHPNTLILVNGTPKIASLVAAEVGGTYYPDLLAAALAKRESHPIDRWVVFTASSKEDQVNIKEFYPHAIATTASPHLPMFDTLEDQAKRIAAWALTEYLFQ